MTHVERMIKYQQSAISQALDLWIPEEDTLAGLEAMRDLLVSAIVTANDSARRKERMDDQAS